MVRESDEKESVGKRGSDWLCILVKAAAARVAEGTERDKKTEGRG